MNSLHMQHKDGSSDWQKVNFYFPLLFDMFEHTCRTDVLSFAPLISKSFFSPSEVYFNKNVHPIPNDFTNFLLYLAFLISDIFEESMTSGT